MREHGPLSVDSDVQNIIRGPSVDVTTYSHMYDSGRHFRTWKTDYMKRTTCNSLVYMLTMDGDVERPYCGTILDIIEVDFGTFVSHLGG